MSIPRILIAFAFVVAFWQPTTSAVAGNSELGCTLLAESVLSQFSEKGCRELIAEAKKADDLVPCAISALAIRMISRKEPVAQRPPGLTIVTLKACAMMILDVSEKQADSAIEQICAKSHDPSFVSECRAAAYSH
jgi:hypothetical protein